MIATQGTTAEWTTLIGNVGVPAALLLGFLLLTFWIARRALPVVLDLFRAHIALLGELQKQLPAVRRILEEQKDSLGQAHQALKELLKVLEERKKS